MQVVWGNEGGCLVQAGPLCHAAHEIRLPTQGKRLARIWLVASCCQRVAAAGLRQSLGIIGAGKGPFRYSSVLSMAMQGVMIAFNSG
jgi:hypothetical protein